MNTNLDPSFRQENLKSLLQKPVETLQQKLDPSIAEAFLGAERNGLKFAIKGKLVAIILLGLFMIFTRFANLQRVVEFAGVLLLFGLLALLQFWLIGSRFDRPWLKYFFITIDIAALSLIVATQPLLDSVDLPHVITFRNSIFPFYFVILGVAAFSFSPGLVLWAGVMGITGWLSAFYWSIRDMPIRLDWSDLGPFPSTEEFVAIFLNPNFVGTGSRIQESLAFFVVAILISAVMWRARQTVQRQLESDAQRKEISDIFGRYVPKEIVDALIADRGLLEPVERPATVMFLDIVGFTKLTEATGPQKIVQSLNAFFESTGEIISRHKGVVTQFQGDAIMATFNLPLEDSGHANNAISSAQEIVQLVQKRDFDGLSFQVRVGISSGAVLAGSVGSRGRQNYTVYGDTVNLASRLETLNKKYGTDILIDEATREQVQDIHCDKIGSLSVRGFRQQVAVFCPSQ